MYSIEVMQNMAKFREALAETAEFESDELSRLYAALDFSYIAKLKELRKDPFKAVVKLLDRKEGLKKRSRQTTFKTSRGCQLNRRRSYSSYAGSL